MTKICQSSWILGAGAFFIALWFLVYLTDQNLPSVDLPSQLALTKELRSQLLDGRITFYDRDSFTGFPAFRFYGFLPALVAAALSFPCELVSSDGVRLATHLMLHIGVALFPFSLFFAVAPIAREILGDAERYRQGTTALAAIVVAFSFWFLNHDQQWYGIGAAAPMNIGLFSQLFAWHLLLLHLGSVVRGGLWLRFAAPCWYALLAITHTLTFVYVSFCVLVAWLLLPGHRRVLLLAHGLGLGLAAFWFLPTLTMLGTWSAHDVSRPTGDFLEILFRYPLYGSLRSLSELPAVGLYLIDGTQLSIPFLVLSLVLSHRLRQSTWVRVVGATVLAGALLFSSGFVATSLQLGLHYYRFLGYLFLSTIVLLCVAPLAWVGSRFWGWRAQWVLVGVAALSVLNTANLPHAEREMVAARVGTEYLAHETRVIEYLRDHPVKGRVYIEYLTDYERFPKLSAHYISSGIARETDREPIVSSHLQESLAYRYIAGSANLLEAKTYNVPLLFPDRADLEPRDLLQQLRDFGISHVVCGQRKFCGRLRHLLGPVAMRIGPYRIFTIVPLTPPLVQESPKVPLGYVENEDLPFHLFQLYFYARKELYRRYELLALPSLDRVPKGIRLVLVNAPGDANLPTSLENGSPLVNLSFQRKPYILDHYAPHYPHNVEFDHYREIEEHFDRVDLAEKIRPLVTMASQGEGTARQVEFAWAPGGQAFRITGAQSGQLLRVNYSYFPYWRARGGTVYRGLGERIFIDAESEVIHASYSAWYHWASWFGLAVTMMAVSFLGYQYRTSLRECARV